MRLGLPRKQKSFQVIERGKIAALEISEANPGKNSFGLSQYRLQVTMGLSYPLLGLDCIKKGKDLNTLGRSILVQNSVEYPPPPTPFTGGSEVSLRESPRYLKRSVIHC